MHLVGEERYQAIHQSLADISDRYIDHITVPDIYLDNNSETVDIHENMHDLILDRSFKLGRPKIFIVIYMSIVLDLRPLKKAPVSFWSA